jgi:hypothetical protein
MMDKNLVGMDFEILEDDDCVDIGRKYLDATKQIDNSYIFTDPYKYKHSISKNQLIELGEKLDYNRGLFHIIYLNWKKEIGLDISSDNRELIKTPSNQSITVKTVVVEERSVGMVKSKIVKDTEQSKNIFPVIAEYVNPDGETEYTIIFNSKLSGTVINTIGGLHTIGQIINFSPPLDPFTSSFWKILPAGVQVILENN